VRLLTQARDLLAQRLTSAILDLGDDLLEDARGESFSGEIDTLHEQIGTRLGQVNGMLAALSASDDADDDPSRPITQTGSLQTPEAPDGTSTGENTPRAIEMEGGLLTSRGKFPPSTYPLFVQDIVRRDLVAAARRLAEVLGTTPAQAEVYATRFRDQLDRDPAFLAKVHSLRQALQTERYNQARLLLRECFGLQGEECEAAMELLKGWL
jgi:hypothetical protein